MNPQVPHRQRFSQIVVIETLPACDMHTGSRIYEDLQSHAVYHGLPLAIKYVAAMNKSELFAALATVLADAKAKSHHPILHFECHGSVDEQGMVLADGSFVSWADLKAILTEINVACRCGLLIVLSLCNGGHLVDIVRLIDRAPCWGLIGPLKPVSADGLLQGFGAFYRVLLKSLDGDLAIKELFRIAPTTHYAFIPAEGFFNRVYAGYLRNSTSDDAYSLRAKKLSRKLKNDSVHVGRGAMKRILKKNEKGAFEKFRTNFFMIDLYPENNKRFDMSYASVKALSSTLTN